MRRRTRLVVVAGLTLAAVIGILVQPPIPQSQAFHAFADQRPLFGIPNLLNVISDAPFVLVGILGLSFLWRQRASHGRGVFVEKSEQWAYVVFFLGVALTGFGSAYYHLVPDNARLVWDRAPMTLVFMSFFAAVICAPMSWCSTFRW